MRKWLPLPVPARDHGRSFASRSGSGCAHLHSPTEEMSRACSRAGGLDDECALFRRGSAVHAVPPLLIIRPRRVRLHRRCGLNPGTASTRWHDSDRDIVLAVRSDRPGFSSHPAAVRTRSFACRCWSGEHLPLGLLAIFLLFFFVVALPVGSFIAVQRLVRRRSQLRMGEEAADNEAANAACMWKAFFPGDYEDGYFWMRHLSWAILVVICATKEYGQVPSHLVVVVCRNIRRDVH